MFFEGFAGTLDPLAVVLADSLLASYLLARFQLSNKLDRADFDEEDYFSFDLPPEEAIRYFREKRVVTSKEFYDLRDEARAAAFTVGGIYREDVLNGFKEEIALALEKGTSQQEVTKRFRSILAGAGHKDLGAFHLETIFRTNMGMSYGVGRRRSLEDVAEDLPFWQYHAVMDDRTRPHHATLDGLTLPYDHEFWNEHFPPWGFNCRCSVTATYALPDGYDSDNPSGHARLVYDEREIPIKAETGTSVIDLSVSRFNGVPPQARLQDVIEFAARRAQTERYRTPQAVIDKEAEIRFDERETLLIYDYEGKLLFTKKGDPDEVRFDLTKAQEKLVKKSVMTHNHPTSEGIDRTRAHWKGLSFSADDILTAAKLQVAEVRAVSFGYRHSMRPPPGGWDENLGQAIYDAYYKTRNMVIVEMREQLVRGKINFDDLIANTEHETWKRVAQQFKLRYRRAER